MSSSHKQLIASWAYTQNTQGFVTVGMCIVLLIQLFSIQHMETDKLKELGTEPMSLPSLWSQNELREYAKMKIH